MPRISSQLQRRISVVVSVVSLAAVAWWISKQDTPQFPDSAQGWAYLLAAFCTYGVALGVRGFRWHRILRLTHIPHKRIDAYRLTLVGYMGNNVLPARAGEVLRVVFLSNRTGASKRTVIGSIIAERLLDIVALGVIFLVTVYGVLGAKVLPTNRPVLVAGISFLLLLAVCAGLWVLRRHHVFERVREWLRPLADAPRAMLASEGVVLLAATFVLWAVEAGVYYSVARSVDLGISVTGAFYLVALTNFVAALPAAPGSIGTFDAAVAWGANRLGATGSAAVSYLLMLRFVLYVPITVVGFLFLVTRYGGWSRLRTALRVSSTSQPPPAPRSQGQAQPQAEATPTA
jgi:glycosyltransferase 2 family protein